MGILAVSLVSILVDISKNNLLNNSKCLLPMSLMHLEEALIKKLRTTTQVVAGPMPSHQTINPNQRNIFLILLCHLKKRFWQKPKKVRLENLVYQCQLVSE
jgi:hypothetical protein